MLISLIVALDEQRGIGRAGGLPWRLRDDLQRFKALTLGHYLIVGRKTYASIGRPLPGRKMLVVTRNPQYQAEGCQVASSLPDALALADADGEEDVFIGGGSEIFALALPLADQMHLTQVHACTDCDVFFPEYDPREWVETGHIFHPANDYNEYSFTYRLLARRVVW